MNTLSIRDQARVLAEYVASAEPDRLHAWDTLHALLTRALHPRPPGTALLVRDALLAMMVGDALPAAFRYALVEPLATELTALTAERTTSAEGTTLRVVGGAG